MALSGMKALQAWCQRTTDGYRDVKITNMTTSWRDGLAFCAIIHKFRPDIIDFDSLSKENVYENNKLAFETAEKELGIAALLDAEDMVALTCPDKLSIMTYVSQYYNYFQRNLPGGMRPVKGYKRPSTSPEIKAKKVPPAEKITEPAKKPDKVDSKTSTLELLKESHRGSSFGDKCAACGRKVYLLERHVAGGKLYHRACFRCRDCRATLRPGGYKVIGNNQFECTLHSHKKDQHKKPITGYLGKDKKSPLEHNKEVKEVKKSPVAVSGHVSNVDAKKKLFENGSAVCVSKTDDKQKKTFAVTSPTKVWHKNIGEPVSPKSDAATVAVTSPTKVWHKNIGEAVSPKSDAATVAVTSPTKVWHKNIGEPVLPKSDAATVVVTSPTKVDRKDIKQPMSPVNDAAMRVGLLQSLAAIKKREDAKIEKKDTKVSEPSQNDVKGLKTYDVTDITKKQGENKESKVELKPKQLDELKISEPSKDDVKEMKTHDVTDTTKIKGENKEIKVELKPKQLDESGQGDGKKTDLKTITATQSPDKSDNVTSEIGMKTNIPDSSKGTDVEMKTDEQESDPLQILEDIGDEEKGEKTEDEDTKSDEYVSADDNNPFGESSESDVDKNPFAESSESDAKNDEVKSGKVDSKPSGTTAMDVDKDTPVVTITENKADIKVVIDTTGENEQKDVVKDTEKDEESEKREEGEKSEVMVTAKDAEKEQDDVSVKSDEVKTKGEIDAVVKEEKTPEIKKDEEAKKSKTEEEDESYNPFFCEEDEEESKDEKKEVEKKMEDSASDDLEDNNPFSTNFDDDEDEALDPTKNPFTGSPVETDEELVNPFTGSPIQKRKFHYPDSASSKYNTAQPLHPVQRTPSGVKSRADVLKELQGSMARQPKKVPPPRPPPPKAHTLQSGASVKLKDAVPSPGSARKPAPAPPPDKNLASSPSRPVRKSRRAPPPPTPGGGGAGSPSPVAKATTVDVKITESEEPKPPPRSPKLQKGDASPKIDEHPRLEALTQPPAKPPRTPELSQRQPRKLSPSNQQGRNTSPSPSARIKRRAPPPPPQRRKVNKSMTPSDIKEELNELDKMQTELEEKGVIMEKKLREGMEGDVSQDDEEEMLKQWFELINNKNGLVRRENELIYLSQQQSLEDEHADVEYELRCLMQKAPTAKTDEDNAREEELIERLMEIVSQRNKIVECMEQDRLREYEEDKTLEAMMIQKGWIEGECEEVVKKEKKKEKKVKEKKEKSKDKEKKKEKVKKKDKEKKKDKDQDKDQSIREIDEAHGEEGDSPKRTKHGVFYL